MEQLVTVATMQGVLELQCGYESWASERALGDEYLCIQKRWTWSVMVLLDPCIRSVLQV